MVNKLIPDPALNLQILRCHMFQKEISTLLCGQLSTADVQEAEQELEQLLASQIDKKVRPSKKREAIEAEV
ncbi:hypothetical protein NECAME_03384 [Necator americanus]|uniref:Uncharacterized protein n=1 Tax=Necator americanus TaxID=51031 RepID=W2T537_NECAM|nr:hypothetical protein NECAME_03384 [Necator americanus]ETN76714.1 hypothetical protein NECAME_03384 [Necator americanus]